MDLKEIGWESMDGIYLVQYGTSGRFTWMQW